MNFWKTDQYKWAKKHPYLGPYETFDEAEAWASEIRRVHRDRFTVIPVESGFDVEQDLWQ